MAAIMVAFGLVYLRAIAQRELGFGRANRRGRAKRNDTRRSRSLSQMTWSLRCSTPGRWASWCR
jgi:hypothetical protein